MSFAAASLHEAAAALEPSKSPADDARQGGIILRDGKQHRWPRALDDGATAAGHEKRPRGQRCHGGIGMANAMRESELGAMEVQQ
jgi:hypothetical protein